MRRHFADFVQTGLAGTEVVVGEAHADVFQLRGEFAHALDFHHRGFVDFDDQVGCARFGAQLHERVQKTGFEGFLRMRVDEQRCSLHLRGQRTDAVLAERLAQFGFAVEQHREIEKVDRRARQLGMGAAAEQLVGEEFAALRIDDRLYGCRQPFAAQQLLELALLGHEVFTQRLAGRNQHGALTVHDRLDVRSLRFEAEPEFGVAEMNHIVFSQRARAADAVSVHEGAVQAVEVGQAQRARGVTRQLGVATAQAQRRHHQFVAGVAPDTVRHRAQLIADVGAIGGHGLEKPRLFHFFLPPCETSAARPMAVAVRTDGIVAEGSGAASPRPEGCSGLLGSGPCRMHA